MTPNLPGLHFPKSPGSVEMLRYIVRRLFSAVPVLFGITLLAFLLGILSPGNPAEILLSSGGESAYTAEQLAEVERQLGLDRPYPQQYVRWIGGVLQGDWGDSFRTKEPVREELFSRFGVTIKLAAGALLLTVMVGIPFGVLSAAREGGLMDRLSQWGSILLLSVPSFWAAILLVGIFAEQLHWLPTSGQETWLHLVLPAIVLSFSTVGTTIRLTRSTVIRELSSQYITAARGKGISQRLILGRHALSIAIPPVLTLLGNYLGGILGGSVVVESVFAINGIGKFALDSIAVRDYPALQGYVMITGFTFVAIHLLTDLLSIWFNPQIRLGGGAAA